MEHEVSHTEAGFTNPLEEIARLRRALDEKDALLREKDALLIETNKDAPDRPLYKSPLSVNRPRTIPYI